MKPFVTGLLVALSMACSCVNTCIAGSPSGPTVTVDIVQAHSQREYTQTFLSGEQAVVALVGDGDTDLDVRVYDEYGSLVSSDLDPTDRCFCQFVPYRTGVYRIVVENLGSVYNKFELGMN